MAGFKYATDLCLSVESGSLLSSLLEAQEVGVALRGKSIISGVSLALDSGSVCALLGHNGAGKTTLLRALVGFIRPTAGRVVCDTEPVAIFENPRFPGDVTVRELLQHHSKRTGMAPDGDAAEAMGISRLLDKQGNALSAGMRQRVSLVIGTMSGARVILIDEPTLGLDPQGTKQLMGVVRSLSARGYSVLLSSHDLAGLEGVCENVICMREGSVTFSGSVRHAAATVAVPSHIVRTTDDEGALRALSRLQIPATRVAGGLRLAREGDLAGTFKQIESVASILEVTVERGLFLRVYDEYASLPDPGDGPQ